MTMKEKQEEMLENVKNWQKLESQSVSNTAQVIQKTGNPVIQIIMEIIQHDSQMHRRVQKWIADSLEGMPVTLNPDDMVEIWDKVQNHIDIEKQMLENVQKQLSTIEGKNIMLVQQYLLKYLVEDETKHYNLLSYLETVKKGMRDSG